MAQILLDEREYENYQKLKYMIENNCKWVVATRNSPIFHQINVWTESEAIKEFEYSNKTLSDCCEKNTKEIQHLKMLLNSKRG